MAKERTVTTPKYKAGQMVVVVAPGPWFGRTGELAESPDKKQAQWVVVVTVGGLGVGLDEVDFIPDPRVWC